MVAVTRREYVGGAAATTLASDITNSSTSITVDDATNWPTGANPFFIVIGEGTSSEEKILCSSRSSNTLTVSSRGADDTSATSHDAGATVKHVWTAQDADDTNKVAAALTTKGDLLVFGTEPTRLPVGANGTIPVADSSDAEGISWGQLVGTLEVTGSAEDATYTPTALFADAVSLALNIPATWSTWEVFVAYDGGIVRTAQGAGSADTVTVRLVVDGTNQTEKPITITDESNPEVVDVSRHAHVTGLSSTGSVSISLQAKSSGQQTTVDDSFLYARAVRTS